MGELYPLGALDDPSDPGSGFWIAEVPETIVLTAEQVTGHDGSLVEVLMRAGQLTRVK
jgi:hypothetical protein